MLDYNSMVKMNRAVFNRMKGIQIEFDTLHVRVLNKDLAMAFAPFQQSLTDTTGTTLRLKGNALWIARKKNDRWKFMFAQAFHKKATEN